MFKQVGESRALPEEMAGWAPPVRSLLPLTLGAGGCLLL